MIDTSGTTTADSSPAKHLLLVILALAFVAIGLWMTQATDDSRRYSADMVRLIGWLSIAVFGLFGAIALWRLLMQRGPVITFSPEGFRDIRVTHDIVPWTAIADLDTWRMSGQQVMIVGLKPDEEQKLRLTAIARMSRGANARLGADGLAVTAQGTKMSHEDLMKTTIAYAERYAA